MPLPHDIQSLLDTLEPATAKAFYDAIERVTSAAQLKAIIGHLEAGNVDAVIVALRMDRSFWYPLDRAIQEAYFQGGANALLRLPTIPTPFQLALLTWGSMAATTVQNNGQGSTPES